MYRVFPTVTLASCLSVTPIAASAQGFEEARVDLRYSHIEGDYGDYSQAYITAAAAYLITTSFGTQIFLSGFRQSDDFNTLDTHSAAIVLTYALTPVILIGASHAYSWYDYGTGNTSRESVYGLHGLYTEDPWRVEGSILFPDVDSTGVVTTLDIEYDGFQNFEIGGQLVRYWDDDNTFDNSYTYVEATVDYDVTDKFGLFAGVDLRRYDDRGDNREFGHHLGLRYDPNPNLRLWADVGQTTIDFAGGDRTDTEFGIGATFTIGGPVARSSLFDLTPGGIFTY